MIIVKKILCFVLVLYSADSGGAVMLFSNTRQWLLVGIIMGSILHENENAVSLHTHIPSVTQWIQSIISTDFLLTKFVDTTVFTTISSTKLSTTNQLTSTNDEPLTNNAERFFHRQFFVSLFFSFSMFFSLLITFCFSLNEYFIQ